MNAEKLFSFHLTLLKIFPIYLTRKWHVNRPENPFHDNFFKIIPFKGFYALLVLKITRKKSCQNI